MKSINNTNDLKYKNYMIVSINRKVLLQNPTYLHDQSTREYRARGNIHQYNKGI